ncbi:hypothetical protein EC412_05345 [Salmonella enterica subsp. enterica serovar Redlands]|nr:hypothetical protein [Salmonella enterica subsp. enterica serovar Redlands]
MLQNPLAYKILKVAADHGIQAGEALPEKAFDLLLDENPETIGEALMELYLSDLLEEVPQEVDKLTQAGADYIYRE